VRGRYPHDFLLPSVEEAEEFYQITLEIKELVIMEIKAEVKNKKPPFLFLYWLSLNLLKRIAYAGRKKMKLIHMF
jgi:hypothetical protein